MGCGYLTGAGTVVNVLKPSTASTMVIMGMGAVGVAALLAARALGLTRIVTVDIVDEKLQLALELGATHTINILNASDSELAATIRRYLPDGADYIIDTTGVGKVLQAALRVLAVNGTFTLIGAMPPDTELKVNALDVLTGCKKIIGVILAWSDPQQVGTQSSLQGIVHRALDTNCLDHSSTGAVVQGRQISCSQDCANLSGDGARQGARGS
jgi:Zn-dependent alcohol dehydrogenase